MNNWNINKGFEEKMTPFIDEIYKKLFNDNIIIERSTREEENEKKLFMDINFSIDTLLSVSDFLLWLMMITSSSPSFYFK